MPLSVIIATFGYILNDTGLTQKHKFLQKSSAAWSVSNALKKYIRFQTSQMNFLKLITSREKHKVSNEELFETNHGKNIKFKVFTQKNSEQNIDLIGTLNKAIDDPDSKMMAAKYYKLDEISDLLSSTSPWPTGLFLI